MSVVLKVSSGAYRKCEEYLREQLTKALNNLEDNPNLDSVTVKIEIPLSRTVADSMKI